MKFCPNDGSATRTSRDTAEFIGTVVAGRYRVIEKLGEGGMGAVYLCEHVKMGLKVAIKVMADAIAHDVEAHDRFTREARNAARIKHHNVCAIHDFGDTEEGSLYLAMEYVEGETLTDLLEREGALSQSRAANILKQCASALQAAHDLDIVHRDLKPENIMIGKTRDGADFVKILDFGIAKAIAGDKGQTVTQSGYIVGTPAYMSPEQAVGEDLDARSDLYSLALVFFRMLTGTLPFQAETPQGAMLKRLTHEPATLEEMSGGHSFPRDLETVMSRALARAPDERYPNVSDFATAASVVTGTGSDTPIVDVSSPTRRISTPMTPSPMASAVVAPKNRRRLLLTMSAVVAVVAIGTFFVGRGWGADLRDEVAVFPFTVRVPDPNLQYLERGIMSLLAATMTGDRGPRAVDVGSVEAAWDRERGSRARLADQDAYAIARQLGVRNALLGEVVFGGGNNLIFQARLIDIEDPGGMQTARVEGPADSLLTIVEGLTSQLIAQGAGVSLSRLSPFLPALRAYLGGQEAYRQGRFDDAREQFDQAIQFDSAFALAGLRLVSMANSAGDPMFRKGLRVAWLSSNRLSTSDSAFMAAIVGPQYPGPSTLREYFEAWEHASEIAPEEPEALFQLGDAYARWGRLVRGRGSRAEARTILERARELDSSYVEPLTPLIQIAVLEDNAEAVRGYMGDLTNSGHASGDGQHLAWLVATYLDDARTLADLRSRLDTMSTANLRRIVGIGMNHGFGMEDVRRAAQVLTGREVSESKRRSINALLHSLALNGGQPDAALSLTEELRNGEPIPGDFLRRRVLDALYWDGDSVAAAAAADILESRISISSLPTDALMRQAYFADVCAAELWALQGGSSRPSNRMGVLRLAVNDADSARTVLSSTVCAAIVETVQAVQGSRDDAGERIRQLDSIMRAGPAGLRSGPSRILTRSPGVLKTTTGLAGTGLEDIGNIVLARLHEERGDHAAALAAIERRPYYWNATGYLSTYLRAEGRLAELVNDNDRAIRALQHYVALRTQAESSMAGDAASAAADLERLMAGSP